MARRISGLLSVLCLGLLASPGCDVLDVTFLLGHRGPYKDALTEAEAKAKKGPLSGGLLAGLAGGTVGAYQDRCDKDAAATKEIEKYRSSQGVVLKLASASANPAAVAPGGQLSIDAAYVLLAPSNKRALRVTEARLVTFDGVKVAELMVDAARAPGTYTSKVSITLPADAAKGKYEVLVTVLAAGQSTQLRSEFTVN